MFPLYFALALHEVYERAPTLYVHTSWYGKTIVFRSIITHRKGIESYICDVVCVCVWVWTYYKVPTFILTFSHFLFRTMYGVSVSISQGRYRMESGTCMVKSIKRSRWWRWWCGKIRYIVWLLVTWFLVSLSCIYSKLLPLCVEVLVWICY